MSELESSHWNNDLKQDPENDGPVSLTVHVNWLKAQELKSPTEPDQKLI